MSQEAPKDKQPFEGRERREVAAFFEQIESIESPAVAMIGTSTHVLGIYGVPSQIVEGLRRAFKNQPELQIIGVVQLPSGLYINPQSKIKSTVRNIVVKESGASGSQLFKRINKSGTGGRFIEVHDAEHYNFNISP